MLKVTREIKVGFTLVAALFFFIWGFNFLKGRSVFTGERMFYSVYSSASNLVASSPIFINGIKVGNIKEVGFHPDGSNRVLVKFAIHNKIGIPVNSVAKIFSSDLMGSKAVEIALGNSMQMAKSGDTLTSNIQASLQEEVNRQVLPLKAKAESLMQSIDSAMIVIRFVFNEKTRENLEMSFASIKNTIKNLENTTGNIDTLMKTNRGRMGSILANIDGITANIKNNNQKITSILSHFSDLSDTLSRIRITETITHLNSTLTKANTVMEKINKGEGTIGLLINNDSLYNELNASSRELKLLLEDVRLNPTRYVTISVFGGSQKKPYVSPRK